MGDFLYNIVIKFITWEEHYGTSMNNETIEKMTSEIDAKLLEYENNHKSGTGKWYTVDDMNEMIDEVISKHV